MEATLLLVLVLLLLDPLPGVAPEAVVAGAADTAGRFLPD